MGIRAASAATAPAAQPSVATEMSMGDPKAKVTLIEYASASCPHCARINNDVFPELKKKYIDTGKVHYIFREVLTPPEQFAGAAFLLARCAGPAQYFPILDDVFHKQTAMYQSNNPAIGLMQIATDHGLTGEQIDKCTSDEKLVKALSDRVNQADKDGFNSTPTFVIGDTKTEASKPMAVFAKSATRLEGEKTLDEISAAIDPLLAK